MEQNSTLHVLLDIWGQGVLLVTVTPCLLGNRIQTVYRTSPSSRSLLSIQIQEIDLTSTCRCTFIDPECLSEHWVGFVLNIFPEMDHYWADYGALVLSRVAGATMVQSQPDSEGPVDKF
ncbi:hypothetical protein V6Z90_000510 [Aspergillus fumigatus]